jgi:hypothetical protein
MPVLKVSCLCPTKAAICAYMIMQRLCNVGKVLNSQDIAAFVDEKGDAEECVFKSI